MLDAGSALCRAFTGFKTGWKNQREVVLVYKGIESLEKSGTKCTSCGKTLFGGTAQGRVGRQLY